MHELETRCNLSPVAGLRTAELVCCCIIVHLPTCDFAGAITKIFIWCYISVGLVWVTLFVATPSTVHYTCASAHSFYCLYLVRMMQDR